MGHEAGHALTNYALTANPATIYLGINSKNMPIKELQTSGISLQLKGLDPRIGCCIYPQNSDITTKVLMNIAGPFSWNGECLLLIKNQQHLPCL